MFSKVAIGVFQCLMLVLYYIGGIIFYGHKEGWTIIDSTFFITSSVSTIGYGDFVPTSDESRLFTSFYVLIGLVIVITLVDDCAINLVIPAQNVVLNTIFPQEIGMQIVHKRIYWSFLWLVVLVLIGVGYFSLNENWTIITSFYWTILTMTTIGYGDLDIQHNSTRLFSIGFIAFGMIGYATALHNFQALFPKPNSLLRASENSTSLYTTSNALVVSASSSKLTSGSASPYAASESDEIGCDIELAMRKTSSKQFHAATSMKYDTISTIDNDDDDNDCHDSNIDSIRNNSANHSDMVTYHSLHKLELRNINNNNDEEEKEVKEEEGVKNCIHVPLPSPTTAAVIAAAILCKSNRFDYDEVQKEEDGDEVGHSNKIKWIADTNNNNKDNNNSSQLSYGDSSGRENETRLPCQIDCNLFLIDMLIKLNNSESSVNSNGGFLDDLLILRKIYECKVSAQDRMHWNDSQAMLSFITDSCRSSDVDNSKQNNSSSSSIHNSFNSLTDKQQQ